MQDSDAIQTFGNVKCHIEAQLRIFNVNQIQVQFQICLMSFIANDRWCWPCGAGEWVLMAEEFIKGLKKVFWSSTWNVNVCEYDQFLESLIVVMKNEKDR